MVIIYCWVPVHMDIPGNEKADVAEKHALTPLHHQIPISDVKILIKQFILSDREVGISNKINSIILNRQSCPVSALSNEAI